MIALVSILVIVLVLSPTGRTILTYMLAVALLALVYAVQQQIP